MLSIQVPEDKRPSRYQPPGFSSLVSSEGWLRPAAISSLMPAPAYSSQARRPGPTSGRRANHSLASQPGDKPFDESTSHSVDNRRVHEWLK